MNRMSHLIALLLLPAWILSACKPSNPSPNAEGQTILTPISPLVTPAVTLPGSVEELADGGARVITGDGLSLTLDASGQVTALSLNGEALPVNTAQPLLLRDLTEAAAANAPNLLANPGFEEEESGWGRYLTKGDISIQAASDDPREGEHALALLAACTHPPMSR